MTTVMRSLPLLLLTAPLALLAEKTLYESRVYVGPRTIVTNEASPEKQAAKKRQLEEEKQKRLIASELAGVPKGRAYTHPDGRLFFSAATHFVISSMDSLSGLLRTEFSVDSGEWREYSGPFALNEGIHQVSYKSTDKAGNVTQLKSFSATVDASAPEIIIEVSGGSHQAVDRVFVAKGSVVRISVRDALSGVAQVYLDRDGSGFLPLTEDTVSLDDPGLRPITVVAIDNVGNRSDPVRKIFSLDITKPSVSISASNSTSVGEQRFCTADARISITGSDDESGVAAIYYKINQDKDWRLYSKPFLLPPVGEAVIQAKAEDNVGNTSDIAGFKCVLDVTPPKTELQAGEQNGDVKQ